MLKILDEMINIYDNMWLDIAIDNNISLQDKLVIFNLLFKVSGEK